MFLESGSQMSLPTNTLVGVVAGRSLPAMHTFHVPPGSEVLVKPMPLVSTRLRRYPCSGAEELRPRSGSLGDDLACRVCASEEAAR